MADIVLKNVHGEDKTFSGVSVIRVNTSNGGTEEFVPVGAQTEYYEAGYTTGHSDGRAEGYTEGHAKGYSEGYKQGLEEATPDLQEKTVTPTTDQQVVTCDDGYDGLSEVTVESIPQSYTDDVYNQGYNSGQEAGYNSGYATGYDEGVASVPVVPSVNSITTTGNYDSATYHGAYYAAIDSNGNLLVCVVGGTSTSYESIHFTDALPNGVERVNETYYTNTGMPTGLLYAVVYNGITGSVNVNFEFSGTNTSQDYVTCVVTVTYV